MKVCKSIERIALLFQFIASQMRWNELEVKSGINIYSFLKFRFFLIPAKKLIRPHHFWNMNY